VPKKSLTIPASRFYFSRKLPLASKKERIRIIRRIVIRLVASQFVTVIAYYWAEENIKEINSENN
jgi:hypothetical protein